MKVAPRDRNPWKKHAKLYRPGGAKERAIELVTHPTAGLTPPASSVRSGFPTSAAARGASIFKMADQSRHKSMDTLRGYVRDAEIFKRHAGEGLL